MKDSVRKELVEREYGDLIGLSPEAGIAATTDVINAMVAEHKAHIAALRDLQHSYRMRVRWRERDARLTLNAQLPVDRTPAQDRKLLKEMRKSTNEQELPKPKPKPVETSPELGKAIDDFFNNM